MSLASWLSRRLRSAADILRRAVERADAEVAAPTVPYRRPGEVCRPPPTQTPVPVPVVTAEVAEARLMAAMDAVVIAAFSAKLAGENSPPLKFAALVERVHRQIGRVEAVLEAHAGVLAEEKSAVAREAVRQSRESLADAVRASTRGVKA